MDGGSVAWGVRARNLPEHARNPIHTDAGARAAGFERALVAGVTSYAYAVRPVLERFGIEWMRCGSATVRFRSPVFDGDDLTVPVVAREDSGVDVALRRNGVALVEVSAWASSSDVPMARPGDVLEPLRVTLDGEFGSTYGERAGDDLDVCRRAGIVHPAVWPALANAVFHAQVVNGPWVHTRSVIRHHAQAYEGATAEVMTTVVERFERRGRRAIADVVIAVDDAVVASLVHEAIVDASTIGP